MVCSALRKSVDLPVRTYNNIYVHVKQSFYHERGIEMEVCSIERVTRVRNVHIVPVQTPATSNRRSHKKMSKIIKMPQGTNAEQTKFHDTQNNNNSSNRNKTIEIPILWWSLDR